MSTATKNKSHPPADDPRTRQWQAIMSGLREPIAPVRAGLMYQLGLLLVAGAMIVLPIVYVALIALVGYGTFWYATHAVAMFESVHSSGRGMIVLLVVYVAPIFAGVMLMLFMIKPLFAKRARKTFPLTLSRKDEPLLFAFIERLCEVVGAPRPRQINVDTAVNASASFGDGVFAFLRKDLTLTIGLPIVAGMDLRHLTGVLAHEFGHFSQGTGMRVTYLIRSTNMWFARVVYERDSWDEWIRSAGASGGHWSISLTIALTQFCIWQSRLVLRALLMCAHAISSFMLRQMEFDADRYEARVAGSEIFEQTSQRMAMLSVAAEAAMDELATSWRERRLADDLPSLIVVREAEIPRGVRDAVMKMFGESKTHWFDTHPSGPQRIASAKREKAEGTFHIDVPAAELFGDFPDVCRRASAAFYQRALGSAVSPDNLVATQAHVTDSSKKRDSANALRRYFQDLVHPVRAVFPDRLAEVPRDSAQASEKLLELRCRLTERAEEARAAAKAFGDADDRLVAAHRAAALLSAKEHFSPAEFKLKRADHIEITEVRQKAEMAKVAVRTVVDEVLRDAMLRLRVALSLNEQPKPEASSLPPDDSDFGEYDLADAPGESAGDAISAALDALRVTWDDVESMRQHFYVLGELLSRCKSDKNAPPLVQDVLATSKRVSEDLRRIHESLRKTAYPYPHAEKSLTIARYAMRALPGAGSVGAVFEIARGAIEALYQLYMRLLSDLAQRAEDLENSLGLPPLPEPVEALSSN